MIMTYNNKRRKWKEMWESRKNDPKYQKIKKNWEQQYIIKYNMTRFQYLKTENEKIENDSELLISLINKIRIY